MPYCNSFFQCTHPPAIELSELLSDLSSGQFNHVFFTRSGSEASDTQVWLIRRYRDLMGQSQEMTIIARKNAHQGSMLGDVAVTSALRTVSSAGYG